MKSHTDVPVEEEKLLQQLILGLDGNLATFAGPFGNRKKVFADWVASAAAYTPLESFVKQKILPYYANTHTLSSYTGAQTNSYREEARKIIEKSVNASNDDDAVIFVGSGATGAVNKLIRILKLKERSYQKEKPVIFVGPYEHHSNLLPWRETGCEVVNIPLCNDGTICLSTLLELVSSSKYKKRQMKIAAFSAGSNVTGIITNKNTMDQAAKIMHSNGGIIVWDYAAVAPYVDIDMNPSDPLTSKDAVFISPHKFLGGLSTPGLLIMKRKLFQADGIPSDTNNGGGTVLFVTDYGHRYLPDPIHREEGGTPDIVGSIRAGLTFQLKDNIGGSTIKKLEERLLEKVYAFFKEVPNVELLGDRTVGEHLEKFCVLSILIRCPWTTLFGTKKATRFLHYNFVCALLNDLFGIQSRGGCMCAGPYGSLLLGISPSNVRRLEEELVRNPAEFEPLKPGFTRLALIYFLSDAEVDYILEAIRFIAEHGYKLLPFYQMDKHTGVWTTRNSESNGMEMSTLAEAALGSINECAGVDSQDGEVLRSDYEGFAAEQKSYFDHSFQNATKMASEMNEILKAAKACVNDEDRIILKGISDNEHEALRWFVTASEAAEYLLSELHQDSTEMPKIDHLENINVVEPQRFFQYIASKKPPYDDSLNVRMKQTRGRTFFGKFSSTLRRSRRSSN